MPIQDRTNEFRACVQSIRSRSAAPRRQRTAPTSKRSEFASMAANIGKDISSTTIKLGKLAQLAKRKTLFDDKPVEISELTYIIKQDIAGINKQIASLQHYVKSQGQNKAPAQKQIDEHNNNVVMLLQSKLANTSMSFKDVLEIRTQDEQFMYSSAAATTQAPTGTSSLLYAPQGSEIARPGSRASFKGKARADDDLLAVDIDAVEEAAPLVEQQDNYIQSRSTAIESIESTIAELGQIFTQLATMVAEQRETVQRIDADTMDIASNVSGAQRELLKYYSSISSNRWLILKVFGVLIIT
ncbi:t-SNARE, partial [Auriculariales sp. MPI-PUGE-AT-0066]